MRRVLPLLAVLALVAMASPASAGLADRVTSAGQLATEALAAFGRLEPAGMYDAAAGYYGRETAWAMDTYDLTAAFAEQQVRSTAGPVGGFAWDTASALAQAALGPAEENAAAARAGASTCFQGWFPGLGGLWAPASASCRAARAFAEGVLGRPLPPL